MKGGKAHVVRYSPGCVGNNSLINAFFTLQDVKKVISGVTTCGANGLIPATCDWECDQTLTEDDCVTLRNYFVAVKDSGVLNTICIATDVNLIYQSSCIMGRPNPWLGGPGVSLTGGTQLVIVGINVNGRKPIYRGGAYEAGQIQSRICASAFPTSNDNHPDTSLRVENLVITEFNGDGYGGGALTVGHLSLDYFNVDFYRLMHGRGAAITGAGKAYYEGGYTAGIGYYIRVEGCTFRDNTLNYWGGLIVTGPGDDFQVPMTIQSAPHSILYDTQINITFVSTPPLTS